MTGTAMGNGSYGVYHINSSNHRVQRLIDYGYYDSIEEAPGGFYIYLSTRPVVDRVYWNNETCTLTKVDY